MHAPELNLVNLRARVQHAPNSGPDDAFCPLYKMYLSVYPSGARTTGFVRRRENVLTACLAAKLDGINEGEMVGPERSTSTGKHGGVGLVENTRREASRG